MDNKDILFKFGSQASYDALEVKQPEALYFILDKKRIYQGANLISNADESVIFTETPPAAADLKDNVVYVVTGGDAPGLYVKQPAAEEGGEATLKPMGGGKVSVGAIDSIEAFAPEVLDKAADITGGAGLTADDTKMPTSGAVAAAIDKALEPFDTAITGVEFTQGADTGTVLTFTDATGAQKSVTIADMFLSGAEYDPETHILTMTVGNSTEPVKVDLSGLVPQAVNAGQVALSRPITVTAEVGNAKPGDKFDLANTESVQALLEAILSKDHTPTTTQPKLTVTLVGAGALEVGTIFTPQYTTSFDPGTYSDNVNGAQPTGVAAEDYAISDTDGNSATTANGALETFTVADSTNYQVTAVANYGAGAVPTTYLGTEYPAGQIIAGSKTAVSEVVTGFRPAFYGALAGKAGTISSALIRGLTKTPSKVIKGKTYTVNVPAGTMRVVVAFDATLGNVASITSAEEFGAEIKDSFTAMTVQVDDAAGANPITYNVYVKDLATAQENTTTYTVKI